MRRNLTILILALLLPAQSLSQEVARFYANSDSSVRIEATPVLTKYNNYIVGELHDHPQTPAVKLALIKFLHEQKNVNDVFMEVGHAAAWLYNRYLETGDTNFITAPTLVYAGTPAGRRFWSDLYEYNRASLHKITIHGIDFERMEFVKALRLLKEPGNCAFTEHAHGLAPLDSQAVTRVNDPRLVRIYEKTKKDILQHSGDYERCFGKHFKLVREIMFNPSTYHGYSNRDAGMAENTLEAIQKGNVRALLIFVGAKHVGPQLNSNLVELLLRSSSFSGHTATICMFQHLVNNARAENTRSRYASGPSDRVITISPTIKIDGTPAQNSYKLELK